MQSQGHEAVIVEGAGGAAEVSLSSRYVVAHTPSPFSKWIVSLV